MNWQQKDKYAFVLKEFTHSQIEKHNGTKGYPIMTVDNIGVLNESTGFYEFKDTECSIHGGLVKPWFLSDFVLYFKHMFKTVDSGFDRVHDEDDARLKERFEVRLFKAKTHIDLRVAELFYAAGQADRLAIKETMMKWNLKS